MPLSSPFRPLSPLGLVKGLAASLALLLALPLPAAGTAAADQAVEGVRLRPIAAGDGDGSTRVYIVQFREPAAVAEPTVRQEAGLDTGEAPGAPGASGTGRRQARAASPRRGENRRRRFDAGAPAVRRYADRLTARHDAALVAVGAGNEKLYSYRYALNGFAARLTPAQARKLQARKDIRNVWEDRPKFVETNDSASFLGLNDGNGGLRRELNLRGENIVIAVIDSGIAPGHPSLADKEEALDDHRSIWVEAGAAVDANRIGLSMPCPDDFDAFWAAQKKALAAIPLEPKLTPIEGNGVPASVEAFDVQVPCVVGVPVSAYYARPKGAKPRSLPIYLTVHGAGVGSSSLINPSNQAAQGRLAMDLNAHGIPNGRPAAFYQDLLNGALKDYPRRFGASREEFYFRGMYLRLVRAIDFLCSQPEWDGKNVIVAGSSQGGAQAVVAAGLDERVTLISASLPALCDLTGMQVNRSAGWPFQRTRLDANQVHTLRYYDVCHFAARTKATAVVRAGLIDHTCPPAGVLAMYNQLKGTKYLFSYPDAGHSYSPPSTYKPAGEKLNALIAEALKK